MYEFLFGLFCGAVGSRLVKWREGRDAVCQTETIQALAVMPAAPIPVSRKVFVPGELKNFWGKDS